MRKTATILSALMTLAAQPSVAGNDSVLGPNVRIYSPTDDMASIQAELDSIHSRMQTAQFSTERYAILFMPGDYSRMQQIHIGYYTTVAGLGTTPFDVRLNNIDTPSPFSRMFNRNSALCTFWRSLENVYVINDNDEPMRWGVSQAAPIRRVASERDVLYDMGGFASGGFAADCYFMRSAGSRSQQQWYTRNSYIETGSDGINPGGWNYGYQGVEFGPNANPVTNGNTWADSNVPWNVTNIDTVPVIREKPFLFADSTTRLKVFRPAFRHNCKGVSYSKSDMGQGDVLDLADDFYIAMPGVTAAAINSELSKGRNILFTPGIYELESPIRVSHSNTIVMGIGMATLIPGESNTDAALIVEDNVKNAIICSLMFDTYYHSNCLMRVGTQGQGNAADNASSPTLLADLFFRVGGVVSGNVSVETMMEINTSHIIGDHFWLWRADHGQGVAWTKNICKNGLVVNGDNVTIYGLFNEHAQEYQTLWNGEWGQCYFYQSESPYDPQRQEDFMSHNGTVCGYASYKVADHVEHHYATMMGVYDVFTKTGGAKIVAQSAIEVPDKPGVRIHHACNFGLSQHGGGFLHIVNQTGHSSEYHKRNAVLDYGGK